MPAPGGRAAIAGVVGKVGESGGVEHWQPDPQRRLYTYNTHRGGARAVTFSPDGRNCAVGGSDGDNTIVLWRLRKAAGANDGTKD